MATDRRAFLMRTGVGAAVAWVTPEVVTLAAPAAAASTDPPPDPPPLPVLLGVHPQAALQPTPWGRGLQDLAVFDGIVFAGYGDWDANHGPIAASGWDISASSWVNEATLDTESTWLYRRIGDRLVVPFIDPRDNTADLAVRSLGSSSWTTMAIGAGAAAAKHVFDVATFDGTDLWAAGSDRVGVEAAIWHSPTGLGGDWVKVRSFTPPAGATQARFVMLVSHGGRLYTGGYFGGGGIPYTILPGEAWTGAAWVPAPEFALIGGPPAPPGHRPLVFDGQVVMHGTWPFPFTGFPMLWFDGTTVTQGPEQAVHHTVDSSGNLWWIDETLAVRRRSPGGATQVIVQAPAGASCLAVDGTNLYIGTATSELHVVSGV